MVARNYLDPMDRRRFIVGGIAGVGLLATAGGRATSFVPALRPAQPLPLQTAREVLLDRAKASLDRHRAQFALRDRVALADFSVASRETRFHIVDLHGGHISSYLVAHGRGSDPGHSGYLEHFSNVPDSKASSAGAYRTDDIYFGEHGQSMRLIGLDAANSNAEPRAIVVHGAPYVSEDHIATWGKIGRSEGCFAVAEHMVPQVLGLLGRGRMIYADKVVI